MQNYNLIDKVVFYSKSYNQYTIEELTRDINSFFPNLKVFTRSIQIHSTFELLPQIDIFEVIIILNKRIIKDFYNKFQSIGVFLKNEVPINPLKEL